MQTTPESSTPAVITKASEAALISALTCIVLETMAFTPVKPIDGDSFLPAELITQAQQALAAYGLRVQASMAMTTQGGAA